MKRLVGLAIAAALLLATSASAVELAPTTPPTRPWQQWANESQMPTYPGQVTFTELTAANDVATCTEEDLGCMVTNTTDPAQPPYEVAVSNQVTGYTDIDYAESEWHELGHVFDASEMTDADRAAFMTIWGLPGGSAAWWTHFPVGETGWADAGEWFAEGYRLCAHWGAQIAQASDQGLLNEFVLYGYPGLTNPAEADPRQTQVCNLIIGIGQRQSLAIPAQRTYPRAAAPPPAKPAARHRPQHHRVRGAAGLSRRSHYTLGRRTSTKVRN